MVSSFVLKSKLVQYFVFSELSALMASDGTDPGKFIYPPLGLGNSFAFKFEDLKGRVHRFNCGKYLSSVNP